MADSSQEKTEQATARKLHEASNRGQVAYSREITAAAGLLAVVFALRLAGGEAFADLAAVLREALALEQHREVDRSGVVGLLSRYARSTMAIVLPLLLGVMGVVALGGYLQVGFSVSSERLRFELGRLNPLSGMRKLFSVRSVFGVLLAVAKLALVGFVAWGVVGDLVPRALQLATEDARALFVVLPEALLALALRVGVLVMALAVADLLWQRWRFAKDMMMTKEEVKEEARRGEGDPQIKARIRRVQREIARARMMKDVKKATVVVRNPVHFAVALKYERGRDEAPRVVAKGKNLIALRIIRIAEEAGVPVRTEPPLARELYHGVRVGQVIPEALFRAVARVLAWVYRQKARRVQA